MRRDRYRDESLNCRNSEFSGCVSLGPDVTEAISYKSLFGAHVRYMYARVRVRVWVWVRVL